MEDVEFKTFEEAIAAIRDIEISTESQFVVTRKTKNIAKSYTPSLDELQSSRIRFAGSETIVGPSEANIPFVVIGGSDFSCIFGKGRKQQKSEAETEEDNQYGKKKRVKLRPTKKQGCPCLVKIQEVLAFSSFGAPETKKKQLKVSRAIKNQGEIPEFERRFILSLRNQHVDHVKGKVSGLERNLSKEVSKKIKELAGAGITRTEEVKKEIERHVDTLPLKRKPSKLNEQYYPSSKTIYNHVQMAICENRYSMEEQSNIRHHLETLCLTYPGLQFYFRQHELRKMELNLVYQDPIVPDIEDIWTNHHASKSLMAVVGQYKLYGYSFGSLQSGKEVSDEVIDAYMQSLIDHNPNTKFIDCVVTGKLLQHPSSCALLTKTSFEQYSVVLCPFNMNEHWELLVIFPKNRKIMYLNPLGETAQREKEIFNSWKTFINRRWARGLEEEGPSRWQMTDRPRHSRLTDSVSCGIFIMKFAELILQEKNLFFKSRDIDESRKAIASVLLGCCGNVTNFCRACSQTFRPSDGWIQCNSCQWWHHFECTGILNTFEEAGRDSFYFLCNTCQGNDICDDIIDYGFTVEPTTSRPLTKKDMKITKSKPSESTSTCKPSDSTSTCKPSDSTSVSKPSDSTSISKPSDSTSTCKPSDSTDCVSPTTTEAFVVCKLKNIVKICAGCRTKFKKPVKTPNDFVIRHRELDSFFDKKLGGMRKVFNNKYYHISANCIQSRNPFFLKSSICIPPDIQLSDEHLTYFKVHGIDLTSFVNRKL